MKTLFARGGLLALLSVSAFGFSLAACCSGPTYLNIFYGDSIPPWGGSVERGEVSFLSVEYEVGPSSIGPFLEFYEDDAPVEVAVASSIRDNRTMNGCGESNVLHFDISELEPGRYTVVHREANGTGDPLHCNGCEWSEYEGENAVSFELVVSAE